MKLIISLFCMIVGVSSYASDTGNITLSQSGKAAANISQRNKIVLSQRDEEILYSKNLNYIYEPYWSYNQKELVEYGMRIIERIKPLIVEKEAIHCNAEKDCTITVKGKNVNLRKVSEFGRVLPLLYLRDKLQGSKDLGVPLMFLVPKNPKGQITFTFYLPKMGQDLFDVGNNPFQVKCDDFEIYQEYISGEGKIQNKSFAPHGHLDFNATQIIRSSSDQLDYLIDTKDQKNFILPIFFGKYEDVIINPIFPEMYLGNEKDFRSWERKLHLYMIQTKITNFGDDIQSWAVTVPCGLTCNPRQIPSPPSTYRLYDFIKTNPPYALRMAITKGDIGGVKSLLAKNPNLSLLTIGIPDPQTLKVNTPILASIRNITAPKDRLTMVKLLASKGASLDGSMRPAIDKDDLDLVNYLLDKGIYPTAEDVTHVVLQNKLYILRSLVYKVKNKSVFEKGLYYACKVLNPNSDVIKTLLVVSSQQEIFEALKVLLNSDPKGGQIDSLGLLLIDALTDIVPDDVMTARF